MALAPGTRIGPYEIGPQIGAGGMGEVYRATDTNLKRAVALKVLPQSVATDPDRLARFQREAEILAALNHPNIAHVHGLERGAGMSALVMELVDGPTLADRIRQGAIPVDEALLTARQIAEALEAAHDRGIVHRDLKPANIKVRDDGTVKVLDFGLAKAMEPAHPASDGVTQSPTMVSPALVTGAGVLLGTAAYMSPEQAKGRVADKRSDVWAFGVVLYEMLAGRRAFPSDDLAEALAEVIKSDPDWAALPVSTPPGIRRLVRRCLEKDPKRRVPDIAVARFEIDEAIAAPPALSGSTVGIASTPRATSLRPALLLAVALLSAAGASLITWTLVHRALPPPVPVTRFGINLTASQALALSLNDRDLAMSPDGSRIVYTAGAERQLMVRALDALEPAPLAGITGARAPFMSPDGNWVGFFDRLDEGISTGAVREGVLRKVSTAGGTPIVICPVRGGSRGATWGSDDTIVFATSDTKTGLLSVSAAGGEPHVLSVADSAKGERDHQYPSLLPGGRGVLFTIVGDEPIGAQVAVLDLRTRERRTIVRHGSHAEYIESGHVVYEADGTLWAARFDLDKLQVVGDPKPVVERVMAPNGANFALSRHGTLAYVPSSSGSARSLVWVDRTGREEPIQAPALGYVAVRLSPDATRIAFAARDGTNMMAIIDLVHQTSIRIGLEAGGTNPVWTPDGRFIVFSTGPAATRTLARHASDGGGTTERLLTMPGNIRPLSFSPDGATLVFERYVKSDQGYDLYTLNLDGGSPPTELLATPFDERNPAISPDGRWLAYESNESGRDQVYVRPFPRVNDGQYQISTSGGRVPVWSRNGRELFFVDGTTLMSAAVELSPSFKAGPPGKLFDGPSLLFDTRFAGVSTVRSYDVFGDGRRFLLIKQPAGKDDGTAPTGIIVVEHWTEELERLVPTR